VKPVKTICEKRFQPVAALLNLTHSPLKPGPRTAFAESLSKNYEIADKEFETAIQLDSHLFRSLLFLWPVVFCSRTM